MEFVRAQRRGLRVSTPHFVLLLSAPDDRRHAAARLGLVVPRKIGGAVRRNRVKRLCRECFRAWPELLPPGVDLVVVARPGAHALTLATVRAEWEVAAPALRKRAAEALARTREQAHVGPGRGHGRGA